MNKEIIGIAREMRKNQTETEKILWDRLRNRRFLNKKFLRQHPICFQIENSTRYFIADFFCSESNLIIEIDGDIHLKQKSYDHYRDLIADALGIKTLRVTNRIIKEDLDRFLDEVLTPLLFLREGAGG
jgi:very-short-patch-repair endonuclease